MTRFDSVCLYAGFLCVMAAIVVGFVDYRCDILQMEATARQVMPGCRHKYTCTVSYEHGKPKVEMAKNP